MRVLLPRVDVCGRDFTILETDETEYPELDGLDGQCDREQATIYIQAAQAETVRIDTLFHELLHACLGATGTHAVLAAKNNDGEDLEEVVVCALSSSLRGALKSAGWKEPKRVGKAPRKLRKKETT